MPPAPAPADVPEQGFVQEAPAPLSTTGQGTVVEIDVSHPPLETYAFRYLPSPQPVLRRPPSSAIPVAT